mgnify:CR=1 FL=1
MGKKALEELVFHDDFMFAAVMMDAENCRCFLERVLEMKIGRVEISRNMVSSLIRKTKASAWMYLQRMRIRRIMILRCSW